MLEIESAPPESATCQCCGAPVTYLTRFVSLHGSAYAIYCVHLSAAHSPGFLPVLVSIGDWADDAPSSRRQSFFLHIRETDSQYVVDIRSADESPWNRAGFFGRTLDRQEALRHPRLAEVFHITDHIATQDALAIEFLASNPRPA